MIDFLADEFAFSDAGRALLLSVSPAAIGRVPAKEKAKPRIKGKSPAKPGTLLKNQIPVRVFFARDERKPGFFEPDTVCHRGAGSSGEFCVTLALAGVYSGWTEVRSLRSRARRRAKQDAAQTAAAPPFPLRGIGSDNGGEFINEQLLAWRNGNRIRFTRSRPCRKNGSCFVEQKNGGLVRKMIGYSRFDTDFEHKTLADACRFLRPLINFRYPAIKLIGKEKPPSGRYKKIYEKEPKTPYQRLLDSPDVSDAAKEKLLRMAACLNPVELKKAFNKARDALLQFSREKANTLSASA